LVSQRCGEQAALVLQVHVPVVALHVAADVPPVQATVGHASHDSVVVLQWFGPHTRRGSLVHAGKQMPEDPVASARQVYPVLHVLGPPGVGHDCRHNVCGIVVVPTLTHVAPEPQSVGVEQLSIVQ
jgi:hypothetical protein